MNKPLYSAITFVGNRDTPVKEIKYIAAFAKQFVNSGAILRSGNAHGFDQVLSDIPSDSREIYLPYVRFGRTLEDRTNVYIPRREFDNYPQAEALVRKLHPNKNLLPVQMQSLAKEVYLVLGKDLQSPSDIVFCWTKDGAYQLHQLTEETGRAAMAIRVAIHYNIPVVNINSDMSWTIWRNINLHVNILPHLKHHTSQSDSKTDPMDRDERE